ncbi:MAG: BtrH N-terminal domain-containing protein [Halieaceae bacterium]|jgi:hypothetical protein|nr:BtrH N-terminal domain-containing protein [Halieaceae bacterium]
MRVLIDNYRNNTAGHCGSGAMHNLLYHYCRPTMLSGDIYYLDYRNFKVHSPGHRFVLLGFDDELGEVYIADRTDEETQTCSMQALRLSRNPPGGLSTHNALGKCHSSNVRHSMPDACGIALRKTVERMLGFDTCQQGPMAAIRGCDEGLLATGLKGLRTFIEQLLDIHETEYSLVGHLADTVLRAG